MSQDRPVFQKANSQSLELHGSNGEWWFLDGKGVHVEGKYFSDSMQAFQWAHTQGYRLVEAEPATVPKLFTAITYSKEGQGYEPTAFYVAAMDSQDAERVLLATHESVEQSLERFIITDELMAEHPTSVHLALNHDRAREVLSEADFRNWVEVMTSGTTPTYRRF
ncbi:TPA: hypothetical protein NNM78_002207 [Pseudomonas aeruginosa]|nr:hypothetical protein [Pseudomonas aeruginosa]